jgi:TrmH family RNA methyltransferase
MSFSTITSPRNERIKTVTKLRRRKHRGEQQRTLIDGARELTRAIDAGVDVIEIYVCPSLCNSDESRRLSERLEELPARVFEVSSSVFGKLAYGERADGFVGVASPPETRLCDIALPDNPLVAVLEAIEKPGNLGAVVRSADAAGVSAVVVSDCQTDVFNPNVIRASLGTVFSMPVCPAATADVLPWLRSKGLRILAARVDGQSLHTEIDLTDPAAIVLGSEATGLSGEWQASDITPIRLPMLGIADSLNVSAAAAVLFYEAQRQRAGKGTVPFS